MFPKNNKKIIWAVLGILFFSNILVWLIVYDLNRPRLLEVVFFDVGQGDSIFIETPSRQQILIDGGPTSAVLEKLAKEMPFYDKTIDLMILTHPENDHMQGLFDVLERYEVESILWTGVVRDTDEWKEWIRLIQEEGADIKIAQRGQKIIFSENPFIFIDILNPFENSDAKKLENSNDASVVVRLSFSNSSFLFTGDISKKTELKLVGEDSNLKSEFLKIAHHGSKNSSSPDFLEAVSPKFAVISVGENNYGHPNQEVLSMLKESDIEILRTDEKGDIKIISDGNNFNVE